MCSMIAQCTERSVGRGRQLTQNAEDHQCDDALAGRALVNVVAVPVEPDWVDEVGAGQAGGKIGLGVQPTARAQCRIMAAETGPS